MAIQTHDISAKRTNKRRDRIFENATKSMLLHQQVINLFRITNKTINLCRCTNKQLIYLVAPPKYLFIYLHQQTNNIFLWKQPDLKMLIIKFRIGLFLNGMIVIKLFLDVS